MARKRGTPDPDVITGVVGDEDEVEEASHLAAEDAQSAIGDIAVLTGDEYDDISWSIFRYRTDDEVRRDPRGQRTEFVGKRHGPIDAEEFQLAFGGGTFDLRGYAPRFDEGGGRRGVSIRYRIPSVTVAGPRRDFSRAALEPAAAVIAEPVAGGGPTSELRLLLKMMRADRRREAEQRAAAERRAEIERQEREADRRRADDRYYQSQQQFQQALLAMATKEPPAPPRGEKMTDMVEAFKAMKGAATESIADPVTMMTMMGNVLKQGIKIGQGREAEPATEGEGENSTLAAVSEIAKTVGLFMQQQRGAAAPAAAPVVNGTASHAEVVNTRPGATPPQHPPGTPQFRVVTAMNIVTAGMLNGRTPDVIADAVSDTLTDQEVANLKGMAGPDGTVHPTALEVLQHARANGLGQFPQLESPQGIGYLDSVLAALRTEVDIASEDVNSDDESE